MDFRLSTIQRHLSAKWHKYKEAKNLLLTFYSFWGWGLYFAALNIYSTIIEIEIFTTVIEIEIFTTDR